MPFALSVPSGSASGFLSRLPRWSGGFALFFGLCLSVVLAWQAVQIFWLVLAGPEVASDPVPPVPKIQPAAVGRDGFRWDLFGETQRAAALPQVVAPAAQTDLQLRGLMSGGEQAFAIVADARGNEAVYHVGDELPDGSVLRAIEPLQILLERDGRQSALRLEREFAQRPRVSAAVASRPPGRSAAPNLPGIRGFQAPAGISAASVQQPMAAPAGLADQISVLPVAGGGYRVRPGRDATLFAELGLQVNDVVTAVNGQPLTSREDAQALFADVLRRGEVSITITRQGQERTLRPDLTRILSRIE
jgi:general secretion pathway protein C